MVRCAHPLPYVHHSVPNRSLGPVGRRRVLAGIAATTLGFAVGMAVAGAWLVLPLGRLMSDEGRRRLAGEIRGWIPVTAK